MSSYGLWLSATGMKVQEHLQTVYANNLANMDTTAFKRDLAVVLQRPAESREGPPDPRFAHPVLDNLGGGVNVRPTHHALQQGPLEWTGRPLDAAIDGGGFFAVSDGAKTRYTRDGQFTTNGDGDVLLSAGGGRWRLLDDRGVPIGIDPQGGPVSIAKDGDIVQGGAVVATIGLMTPQDPQGLRKQGENLFAAERTEMQPDATRLIPEFREESNVDVMTELVSMIEASRAYQLNANLVQLQDHVTGQAVSTVGRLT